MKHTTNDGLITVDAPDEPGWIVEATAGAVQANTSTTFIRCKRTVPGEFLFLMAKDYTVAPEHVVTPEQLLRQIYPGSYARVFQEVKIDVVRTMVVGGRTWWEAGYRFLHSKLGPIAKLERVTCIDDHVLLVSGEGKQPDVRTNLQKIASWMDTAVFATAAAPA